MQDPPGITSHEDHSVQKTGQLGIRLADLRKRRKLSQRELAAAAGLSPQTVSSLESVKSSDPRLSTLLRLQAALDLSSIELLLGGLHEFPSRGLGSLRIGARSSLGSDEDEGTLG